MLGEEPTLIKDTAGVGRSEIFIIGLQLKSFQHTTEGYTSYTVVSILM